MRVSRFPGLLSLLALTSWSEGPTNRDRIGEQSSVHNGVLHSSISGDVGISAAIGVSANADSPRLDTAAVASPISAQSRNCRAVGDIITVLAEGGRERHNMYLQGPGFRPLPTRPIRKASRMQTGASVQVTYSR